MNEHMNAALAARRERNVDWPDLADDASARIVRQAWTPVEGPVDSPRGTDELLDAASAGLGRLHRTGSAGRHAWRCAEAAAWGLARPLPPAIQTTAGPEGGLA